MKGSTYYEEWYVGLQSERTAMSNNTFIAAPYEPNAPIPKHHWEMQMATVCIVNSLTLITFTTRTWYRWTKLKRFRREDRWIVAATIVFVGLFVCQLGASMYGSGLRIENVPDGWLEPHWIFSWGWIGYYLVISMTKVAICCCLLEFLPLHFRIMRRLIVGLCFFIMALAIAESLIWLIQCEPFTSNFAWNVPQTSCIDIDIPRYIWSGLSIPIDIAVLSVPFEVVKRTGLQPHEKKVLKLVFAANLLGTIACGCGIYGTWENRQSVQLDVFYTETEFIMINDIEILCYAVGATFPIFSRFFISKSTPSELSPSQAPRPSWLRTVTSSITSPFTASNSTAFRIQPHRKSRQNTNSYPHLNTMPISETSTNSKSYKDGSPVSDFVAVSEMSETPNRTSTEERESIEREIALHTPPPMVTMNGVNSSVITPVYVSRSTFTKTEDSGSVMGIGRALSPEMGDLESGYGYDTWVEGGSGNKKSGNDDGSGQLGEKHRDLRMSSLYGW